MQTLVVHCSTMIVLRGITRNVLAPGSFPKPLQGRVSYVARYTYSNFSLHLLRAAAQLQDVMAAVT